MGWCAGWQEESKKQGAFFYRRLVFLSIIAVGFFIKKANAFPAPIKNSRLLFRAISGIMNFRGECDEQFRF